MKSKYKDIATSATTFTFIIIALTGTMMFFHLFDNYTKKLHEILGIAFVLFAIFHIFFNWKSMRNYFKKKVFIASAILTLAVSSVFIINSNNKGEHPATFLVNSVANAPLYQSVPILGKDLEQINKKLKDSGLTLASSIDAIAKKNNIPTLKVIQIIAK